MTANAEKVDNNNEIDLEQQQVTILNQEDIIKLFEHNDIKFDFTTNNSNDEISIEAYGGLYQDFGVIPSSITPTNCVFNLKLAHMGSGVVTNIKGTLFAFDANTKKLLQKQDYLEPILNPSLLTTEVARMHTLHMGKKISFIYTLTYTDPDGKFASVSNGTDWQYNN